MLHAKCTPGPRVNSLCKAVGARSQVYGAVRLDADLSVHGWSSTSRLRSMIGGAAWIVPAVAVVLALVLEILSIVRVRGRSRPGNSGGSS